MKNQYTKILAIFITIFCMHSMAYSQEPSDIKQALELITVPQFSASYNEFIATISTYEMLVAKGKKPELVVEMKKGILLRGIELVKQLQSRANQTANNSSLSAEYQAIQFLFSELFKIQKGLSQFDVPFLIAKNGPPLNEQNIQPGTYDVNSDQLRTNFEKIGMSRGARLRGKLWRLKANSIQGAVHFTQTYSAFMIATGLLTFVDLSKDYEKNPVALDQYIDRATDVMGGVSFMAFMATSGVVSKQLYKVKSKAIPKTMIPYIGMVAGFVASSLFYELATDVSLYNCIRSRFEDDQSCDTAFDTWVIHNKIIQYTPAIISLTTSAALSGGLTSATVKTLSYAKSKGAFSGVWMGAKSEAVKKFGSVVLKSRYALSVGSFLVFLIIDRRLSPKIQSAFNYYRLNKFDLKAWLDEKYFHRDYWRENPNEPLFYIEDVFEVEATNLPTAQSYLDQLFDLWRGNQWTTIGTEYTPDACYIKGISLIDPGILQLDKDGGIKKIELSTINKYHKPAEMIRCEMLSQPQRLMARYNEVQENWRTYVAYDFYTGMLNWLEWLDLFSTDYLLHYKFYEYFSQIKFDAEKKQIKPDLSLPALLQKMLEFEMPGQTLEELDLQAQNQLIMNLNKVLRSMACGVQPQLASLRESGESASLRWFGELFVLNSQRSFLTPYGSAAEFVGPSVVGSFRRSACHIKDQQNYGGRRYYVDEKIRLNPEEPYNENFDSPWRNEEGTYYNSLPELILAQFDPQIWDSTSADFSGFNQWWVQQIKQPIADVWKNYEAEYKNLYYTQMVPSFFMVKTDLESYETGGILMSYTKELTTFMGPTREALQLLKSKYPFSEELVKVEQILTSLEQKMTVANQQSTALAQRFEGSLFSSAPFNEDDKVQLLAYMENFSLEDIQFSQPLAILQSLVQDTALDQLSDEEFSKMLTEDLGEETIAQVMTLVDLITVIQKVYISLSETARVHHMMDFNSQFADEFQSPLAPTNTNPYFPN